jgi:hypothetical protein
MESGFGRSGNSENRNCADRSAFSLIERERKTLGMEKVLD